jgi:hypothetical protein
MSNVGEKSELQTNFFSKNPLKKLEAGFSLILNIILKSLIRLCSRNYPAMNCIPNHMTTPSNENTPDCIWVLGKNELKRP